MPNYITTTEIWPLFGHDHVTTDHTGIENPYLSFQIAAVFLMCVTCCFLCVVFCMITGNGWWCCADPDDWNQW